MIAMTLAEVMTAVGGRPGAAFDPAVVVRGPASTDSRSVPAEGLYVAVRGARVDGHDYAAAAHAAGAAGVLATRDTEAPTVLVDDVVAALGLLARHVLDRLPDLRVLAVTGSQGKTGTKDYLAALLADRAPTVATTGNNNNELGVPLTALRVQERTRFLVVEMGARGIGHIADLTAVCPPDVAAVLNVGTSHIGEFGSRAAIAAAKGEIIEALGPEGTAVLNADDPLVAAMAPRTRAALLTFGAAGTDDQAPSADRLLFSDLGHDDLGCQSFVLHHAGARASVQLRLPGVHQVHNAAAAAAMALAVGVDLDHVARVLSAPLAVTGMRMHPYHRADGLVVVDDTYNANPESTTAAVESLATMACTGRRIAVLGEMLELGESRTEGHHRVGRRVAELDLDLLVAVGEAGHLIAEGARAVPGWGGTVLTPASRNDASDWLRHNVSGADVVLVKASRGVALEHVVQSLLEGTHPE